MNKDTIENNDIITDFTNFVRNEFKNVDVKASDVEFLIKNRAVNHLDIIKILCDRFSKIKNIISAFSILIYIINSADEIQQNNIETNNMQNNLLELCGKFKSISQEFILFIISVFMIKHPSKEGIEFPEFIQIAKECFKILDIQYEDVLAEEYSKIFKEQTKHISFNKYKYKKFAASAGQSIEEMKDMVNDFLKFDTDRDKLN